jgi:hypothetical protein
METLSRKGWGTFRFHRLKPLFCGWLVMAAVGTALANPITTDSPIGFFTNVASRLLSAELNVDLRQIQIYPTNQYTPAVHRLLQVTANIYDATTTNVYPSVFRPLFSRDQNGLGTNLFVSGYTEVASVTGPGDLQFSLPVTASDLAGTNIAVINLPVNVYGVPWIVGAKKGFPNFNEFYMESAFQLTRKIMVTRQSTNVPVPVPSPTDPFWGYYEMFNLGLTNQFGVECWNSYRSNYTGQINIYVTDDLTMTLTNDENDFNYTTNFFFTVLLQANNWQGYNPNDNPLLAPGSFLTNSLTTNFTAIPVSVYRFNGGGPFLTTVLNLPFETNDTGFGILPQPHWGLTMTNNLRVVMVDTSDPNNWKVIDYVQLAGPCSSRDLFAEIQNGYDTVNGGNNTGYNDLWDTNLIEGMPLGIANQYNVSQGNGNPTYNSSKWGRDQKSAYDQINAFCAFTMGPGFLELTYAGYVPDQNLIGAAVATNEWQMPYTPSALVVQDIAWQANDPLVHYTASDLVNPTGGNGLQIYLNWPGNLGNLNQRYQPWGGNPVTRVGTNLLAVKDPLVTCSDDWDFPTNQSLNADWLGRVHRGTPWQTVYLKSSDILSYQGDFGAAGVGGSNVWFNWTGDTNATDAAAMSPVRDWHLASLLASMFNTNDLRSLLSVNNPDTNAWQGLLDGLTALTNNLTDAQLQSLMTPQFGVIVVSSNSPQASVIANAVETVRTAQAGQFFSDVGDILAIPQLTVNSPFLNWNDNVQQQRGISDEVYEMIPSQLLPLLRADSIGSVAAVNGQVVIQFTGYDGHSYAIEVSSDLVDWIGIATNSPACGTFSFTNSPASNANPQFYRSVLLN